MKAMKLNKTKGELTRDRIIEAGISLFGRRGFDVATLDEIAKRSKTHRPGIITYFGSKEGLLAACVTTILERMRDEVEQVALASQTATELIDLNFDWNLKFVTERRNEGQAILLFYTLASHSKELTLEYEAVISGITAKYHRYLMQGVRSKEFSFTEDPQIIAQILREYTVGAVVHLLALRDPIPHITEAKKKWKIFRSRLLTVTGKRK